jgi:hypothetical protein
VDEYFQSARLETRGLLIFIFQLKSKVRARELGYAMKHE